MSKRFVKRKRKPIKYCSRKKVENPFFKEKRRGRVKKKKKLKSYIISILILSIVFFGFWFFYISNTFSVKEIKINDLARTDKQAVESRIWEKIQGRKNFLLKNSNLLALDEDTIIEDLQKEYNFAKIEIRKILNNTLEVYIEEKTCDLIWYENESYYYIDSSGCLIEKINTLDEVDCTKYPIIENQSSLSLNNDKNKEEKEKIINFSNLAWKRFQEVDSDISLEKFIIKNEKNNIDAKLVNGPLLYLNLLDSPEEQMNNLIILYRKNLKENIYNLSYIDLRYKEKIFYQ
jgi:cell division septal protein FtsQ